MLTSDRPHTQFDLGDWVYFLFGPNAGRFGQIVRVYLITNAFYDVTIDGQIYVAHRRSMRLLTPNELEQRRFKELMPNP